MHEMKQENLARYLTVKQLAALGFIPEGGIRHLIFSNQEFNRRVVRRLGKKILLDLPAFYNFIEETNNGGKNARAT